MQTGRPHRHRWFHGTLAPEETTKEFDNTDNTYEFTFTGDWQTGHVQELHETGFSNLKNKCYQTSINIKSGASGGPVIKDNKVIGINSSGLELQINEEPISFITPIKLLEELMLLRIIDVMENT